MMRQIFVQSCYCFSFNWILSLPSALEPWMARSKRGNNSYRCYSWQHSYKSSNRVKICSSRSRPSRTHFVANSKNLAKLFAATDAVAPLRWLNYSKRMSRRRRFKVWPKSSFDAQAGSVYWLVSSLTCWSYWLSILALTWCSYTMSSPLFVSSAKRDAKVAALSPESGPKRSLTCFRSFLFVTVSLDAILRI